MGTLNAEGQQGAEGGGCIRVALLVVGIHHHLQPADKVGVEVGESPFEVDATAGIDQAADFAGAGVGEQANQGHAEAVEVGCLGEFRG